jgi:hypothetical protein
MFVNRVGGRGFGGGLHDAVEVAGEGALEAAADVAVGLALEGAPGFVCPGFGVAPDAGDRDGVQGPVQCPVSAAVQAVSVRWPLLASSGATPASEANAASLLTRPGWTS